MEKTIKIETSHPHHSLSIEVDNSSEFKDFAISLSRNGRLHNTHIKRFTEEGVEVLEIDSITLRGREVALLKEFLNQQQ